MIPQYASIMILSHRIGILPIPVGPQFVEHLGTADIREAMIRLRADMPPDLANSTLLHECVHIISDLLTLELTEQQVDGIAIGIHSIIKDNPRLIAAMLPDPDRSQTNA